MVWLIISLVIILYILLCYLYKMYINDLNNIEEQNIHCQRRILDLEREVKMNEKMIAWLCDEVAKYKIKKEKEGKKK